MATSRQCIKTMIRSFTNKGKPFCYSNYTLAKKLNKSEKTIANTVSLMKRAGEIDIHFHGKIRYIKLLPKIKNIIPDAVKNFYAKKGTESGAKKGTKSGKTIYNINIKKAKASSNQQITIDKAIDITLVNDIKKTIPDFQERQLEKLVCSADEKIIRKTLREFIKNNNSKIKNPAGLFTHNLYENIRIQKELIKEAEIIKQQKRNEEKLRAAEELKKKREELRALKSEKSLSEWIDDYSRQNSHEKQKNDLAEFILNHEGFNYLDKSEKKQLTEEYKIPENLGYSYRILFKEFVRKQHSHQTTVC